MTTPCQTCNQFIVGKRKDAIHCSKKCRARARSLRRRPRNTGKCFCGKSLEGLRSNAKYCSRQHKHDALRRRWGQQEARPKVAWTGSLEQYLELLRERQDKRVRTLDG